MADFNDKDRCGELHSSEFGTFNTFGITVATTDTKAVIPAMAVEPISASKICVQQIWMR